MAKESSIEWTDATWNTHIGCRKVSQGCAQCYAERDMTRYGRDFSTVLRTKPATFNAPLKWDEPKLIFTCSWSDWFIEEADQWRDEAWDIIRRTPQHTYQILTKRPERILENLPEDWGDGWPNVWLLASVENQEMADLRIPQLLAVPAWIHGLSVEPLLGPVELTYYETCPDCDGAGFFWVPGYSPTKVHQYEKPSRYKSTCELCSGTADSAGSGEIELFPEIDWVITGGESGPGARPMELDWVRSIRDQCVSAGVPFFHKQNGGSRKIDGAWGGRTLDGRTWDEMPRILELERGS
jgi:protein gp37